MPVLVNCPHCSTRVLPLAGRVCPACRQDVDTLPNPITRSDRAVEAVFQEVQDRLLAGHDPLKIAKTLSRHQLDPVDTAKVLSKLEENRSQIVRHAGQNEMLIGGTSCLVGLVLTLATAGSALNHGGGFIVAWGAIVFGGFQFIRGLFRSMDGGG